MRKWLLPILLLWAITPITNANLFHDSNLDWKTIQTEHFRFHFHTDEQAIVQSFWPEAERAYQDITSLLNWRPEGKIDVVFTDEYDVSNGFARVFPRNNINIFISAPDDVETLEDHQGWLELVFRHELVHIVHLDKARGAPLFLRKIFGRQPLVIPTVFPNAMQPLWYIEGLATYMETDTEQGVGRGQSSYYDMLMRMEVMGGVKPIRQINQPIATWPAGTIRYLYGVHYHNFIRDRYGEDKIWKLVEGLSDNIVPYRIDSNTAYVFHRNQDEMWREFIKYLNEKYQPQLDAINQSGVVAGQPVSDDGYVADSVVTLGDRVFYSAFNFRSHPALMVSESGSPAKKVRDLNGGARLSVHKDRGILVTQPEPCRNARFYYDIYRVNPDGSDYRRITDCGRYRFAVWTNKGDRIIAVHNELGINSLQVLDENGKRLDTLWRGEAGEQIGPLAYSPVEDNLIAAVWRMPLGWNLERFDIKGRHWQPLTADNYIQNHPHFTRDGRHILYTSDENGIYNIYRLDLKTRERTRITNVLGGAFYPVEAEDGYFYIGYSPQGANLYHIKSVLEKPVNPLPGKLSPVAAPVSQAQTQATQSEALPLEDYSPWETIAPTWWLPYLQIDDQRKEFGAQTAARDALDRHLYSAQLAFDVENEWLVGGFDYLYDGFWPLIHFGISRETDLYVNGSDDTIRVRDDERLLLETIVPFLGANSAWMFHAGIATEREKDRWLADGVSPIADFREDFAGLALRYISANKYPLSVSRSEGRDVRFIYEDTDVIGNSDRKGQISIADWREFIHLGREHVLGLRLVEGRGRNNSELFRLGGIESDASLFTALTNGRVAPVFDQHDYSLRGYNEGHAQLRGRNMRLFSAEYRFPVWRIERGFMSPPVGINQLHGTVFYDIGGVWNNNASGPADHYAGAGFEVNADLDLLYNFRLNLSLGFAKGFDDVIGKDKVYLRIGSQF